MQLMQKINIYKTKLLVFELFLLFLLLLLFLEEFFAFAIYFWLFISKIYVCVYLSFHYHHLKAKIIDAFEPRLYIAEKSWPENTCNYFVWLLNVLKQIGALKLRIYSFLPRSNLVFLPKMASKIHIKKRRILKHI